LVKLDGVSHAEGYIIEAVNVLRISSHLGSGQDGVANWDISVVKRVVPSVPAVVPHVDRVVKAINLSEVLALKETILLLLQETLASFLLEYRTHNKLMDVFSELLNVNISEFLLHTVFTRKLFLFFTILVSVLFTIEIVNGVSIFMNPDRVFGFLDSSLSQNVKEVIEMNFSVHFFGIFFDGRARVDHPVVVKSFQMTVSLGVPAHSLVHTFRPLVKVNIVQNKLISVGRLHWSFWFDESTFG
jgi:hypothetical protein